MKTKIYFLALFIIIFKVSYSQRDSSIIIDLDLLTFQNLNIIETDEIEIISASRSAKKVEDLPISVFIVTREEIQLNGYITLADVLKSIPGFKVSQPGSGIDGETFLMRGFQGNFYTKIMINNIPIIPSVSGALAIGSQLPIRQAERIEIIYGPASAVYGADATSGVINIITKNPESFNFAQADLICGTNGYTYMNFSVGGKAGKNKNIFQYTLYGSRQDFADMNINHDESDVFFPMHYYNVMPDDDLPQIISEMDLQYTNDITIEQLQNIGMNESNAQYDLYPENYTGTFYKPEFTSIAQKSELIGFNLKYKNLTFSYNYMFRQDHSSLGLTPFLYRYDDPNNFIGNFSNILSLQHSVPFGKFISTTNLSYHNYRLDNYSSYGINFLYGMPTTDVFVYQASDDINFEQLITYTHSEKAEYVTGFSYQHSGNLPTTNFLFEPFDKSLYKPFAKSVDYYDPLFGTFGINPRVFDNIGAFAQAYFTWKKITLIYGNRIDFNSEYDKIWRVRWAFMYKLGKKMTFRLSTGYSYKAPTEEKENYSIGFPYGLNQDSIIYAFVPNALKPEMFRSHEFGFRWKLGINSYFDFSMYNSKITSLIHVVPTNPDSLTLPKMVNGNGNTTVRQYKNIEEDETELTGTQISLVFNNLIPSIKMNAEFYYNVNFGYELKVADEYYVKFDNDENPFLGDYTDTINVTMLPKNIIQANFSFVTFKNMYINVENVWLSSWVKAYIPNSSLSQEAYYNIQGYYNLDLTFNYKVGKNFYAYIKVLNVFDAEYGGIDATRTDIDLPYNPQYKRNFRLGLNYRME
jgi:outer membrane cobalamin receptor